MYFYNTEHDMSDITNVMTNNSHKESERERETCYNQFAKITTKVNPKQSEYLHEKK